MFKKHVVVLFLFLFFFLKSLFHQKDFLWFCSSTITFLLVHNCEALAVFKTLSMLKKCFKFHIQLY